MNEPLRTCGECNRPLSIVRPGKYQCYNAGCGGEPIIEIDGQKCVGFSFPIVKCQFCGRIKSVEHMQNKVYWCCFCQKAFELGDGE